MSNLRHYFDKTAQEIVVDLRDRRLHWAIERMCEEMETTVGYYRPMESGEKPFTAPIIAKIVNVSGLTWHDKMELYDMLLEKAEKVSPERQLLLDIRVYMKALPLGLQKQIDYALYEALERE